jgi:putative transposase
MTVLLRGDFDATQLRGFAKKTKDGPQARRLLALVAIYDGARRTEAAKIGGVGLQIIRDWVMRFNARAPDGLLDSKSTGQAPKLNDEQRHAIARLSGPIPSVHGVVRWRLMDLSQMDIRRVPRHSRQTDAEPGAARHGLPQALSPATPPCASRGSNRGF